MFTTYLLRWHQKINKRVLPWKGIRDPYRIWLSEIILQQTRAEQGLPYYQKFVANYPNVRALAEAPEQELFALWQGLGYYNRCRNLHHTAQVIANTFHGEFPKDYDTIRSLKGIGDYTAAAIASFAFHLPYAVVDGNVIRVLSRVFAWADDPSTASGKKKFQQQANELLDKKKPHLFNQAMMDLGATICTPQNPLCDQCPLQSLCKAYHQNKIAKFPLKKKKAPLKDRYFHFLLPNQVAHLYLVQRSEKDIWQSLYTPYCLETDSPQKPKVLQTRLFKKLLPTLETTQILSHQRIHGFFYEMPDSFFQSLENPTLLKVARSELKAYAFPQTVIRFFHKKNYL